MSIIRKVRSVERIFERLDKEIKEFQDTTHLHCISGCGKCCTKTDIEATPLEFLPLAFQWYLQGIAEQKLDELNTTSAQICVVYSPSSLENLTSGQCSTYKFRGLICRLFGYGASRDKLGQLRLVTCKLIREQQLQNVNLTNKGILEGLKIPIFTDYYQQLMQIDFQLANQFLPINEAIREALEFVLHYYSYRPFPKNRKAA